MTSAELEAKIAEWEALRCRSIYNANNETVTESEIELQQALRDACAELRTLKAHRDILDCSVSLDWKTCAEQAEVELAKAHDMELYEIKRREAAEARCAVYRERINSLYAAIEHGDQSHREWLANKLKEHFCILTPDAASCLLARLRAAEDICHLGLTAFKGSHEEPYIKAENWRDLTTFSIALEAWRRACEEEK